ncbi:DNA recombination protein RmuC [Alicyclobacillus sendaiensis]|uniref:DNA recombination protein RmuC n=1 Tax=Alicyclobacillus sendaiensis TaxID=192387 RepID=UPI0026F425B7|nr:DNA recombination protein RmuC [Alicyclobacillus sendaiensis]
MQTVELVLLFVLLGFAAWTIWRVELTQRNQQRLFARLEAYERALRDLRTDMTQAIQAQSQAQMSAHAEASRSLAQALSLQHQNLLHALGEWNEKDWAQLESFSQRFSEWAQHTARQLEAVRDTVERRLQYLQEENRKELERMRTTVDEKLHQTLERRLGESFQLVSQRLEQVHQGLGEMQSLAAGVGDLKRVLSNVKARGILGEVQLENLLDQLMSPEQYARNVAVKPGSDERVDFAIRLPGREGDDPVWLPIDAKFPLEDYQRLVEAQEAGDQAAFLEAAKALEARIRDEAKSIRQKYIAPPHTTEFALLFLPMEGLFAEVLRRSGLWESLSREYRVMVTGPTTLAALLNSLQMGFRTLAIQKRSSEVWQLLGAIRTEFGKFGDLLARTRKKLEEASNAIDRAATRSRQIERKLVAVEAQPELPDASWEEEA